jgi:hypothetical protein
VSVTKSTFVKINSSPASFAAPVAAEYSQNNILYPAANAAAATFVGHAGRFAD